MSHYLHMINTTWSTIKQFFDSQVKDGQLNPVQLAFARRGYWVQSHILRIPERFGIFSSGPARLQVHQACFFAVMVFSVGFTSALWIACILLLRDMGPQIYLFAGVVAAMEVGLVVFMWVVGWYDRHRAPDYDWGEEWKLRKD